MIDLRKQNSMVAYLLIGIGFYYLLEQLSIPFLEPLTTWPSLLIIFGISLLIHSYLKRDYDKLFPSILALGFGIHYHALTLYPNWLDHWSVYAVILGIAFLLRYQKTKTGLYPGLFLLLIGLFMIISLTNNPFSDSVDVLIKVLEDYWPVGLIVFGVYLLFKKR